VRAAGAGGHPTADQSHSIMMAALATVAVGVALAQTADAWLYTRRRGPQRQVRVCVRCGACLPLG
jgi:hypothetical protein